MSAHTNHQNTNTFKTCFRPMKIGGSRIRAAWELCSVFNPLDNELFKGVGQGLFSLEGSKWSISTMGGNNCSFSDAWVIPRDDIDAEVKHKVANWRFVVNCEEKNERCIFIRSATLVSW